VSRSLASKTGVDEPGTALDSATGNPEWRASLQRLFDDPGLHIASEPAGYRVVVELHPPLTAAIAHAGEDKTCLLRLPAAARS
jgi:hypothetical protein